MLSHCSSLNPSPSSHTALPASCTGMTAGLPAAPASPGFALPLPFHPSFCGWVCAGPTVHQHAGLPAALPSFLRLHPPILLDNSSSSAPSMQMGLGKTAQSISVLAFQHQFRGVRGPFLVIAPLTTLGHWQREIETWTDMVRQRVWGGSNGARGVGMSVSSTTRVFRCGAIVITRSMHGGQLYAGTCGLPA